MTEATREHEAFFALADALDDLVFVWKPSGEMLWVNRAFVRETGMTVEDFGFQNQQNPFIHPDDLRAVLAALDEFLHSEAVHSPPIDNRFIDIWGRVRLLQSRVHKITWQGEAALLLVSTFPKHERPAAADESYRSVVEGAGDGILKLSYDGRILYSNRRFQELCARRAVEIARRTLPELLHAEDRAQAELSIERLRQGQPRVAFEARLDVSEETWLAVNASPLHGDATLGSFLAIARDVTQTRRLEEKVRQAQKLESLGTLAGGIAHDFNNIVTGVLANATMAETLCREDSGLSAILQDIRLAAERAAALNAALLAYVGQAPTKLEVLDVARVATETARMLRPLLPASVQVDVAHRPSPHVKADLGQLSQVLINLITNAAQAIGDRPGHVSVETGSVQVASDAPQSGFLPAEPAPGSYALLCVSDDGEGMSSSVIERIFDPFFSTKGTGRGLGLSATLGIVRRHGGAIRIESELGKGTRFELLLPPAEAAAVLAAETPASTSAATDGGLVLFVDDELLLRRLGQRILQREGYEVMLAGSGEEALDLLSQNPSRFSVLVVDHSLPGLRGDRVATRARELRPGLPVVKASGYRDVEGGAAEVEGAVFLPKPYTREALLEAIRLARARAPSVRLSPSP